MLITRRGLGAINPIFSTAANIPLVQGGQSQQGGSAGTYSEEHAGGFSITQFTWQQVVIESNPIRGASAAEWDAKLAYWRNAVATVAASSLAPCDPGALTDGGTSCYYGRYTPLVSWNPDDAPELLPPGVFAVYSVPFGVYEMQDGKFVRAFVPSAQQRRDMEWAVIHGSQVRLFGNASKQTRIDARFLDDGYVIAQLKKLVAPVGGNARELMARLSVDQMIAAVPDMMLFSINFLRNSIQPTPEERTSEGGFYAWIARGGFPLSKAVVTGQAPTSDAIGIQFCTGFECACPSGGANAGFPSCVPAGFNSSGVGSSPSEGSFHPYVRIPQDAVKSDVQLSLVHNDPSWITKFGNIGAKVMQEIAGAFCANQGFTQEYLQNQMKPKYIDAAGKACTKGAPGCKEVKPSSSVQGGVGVFNAGMKLWCDGWGAQNLPDPMQSLPPVAPPAPIGAPFLIPMWVVGVLGVLGGAAAAYSRRSS